MRLSPLSCQYGSTFLLFVLSLTSNVDALVRRSGACAARISSMPAKTTSVAPTPAPSCYPQNEDSDQGINERGLWHKNTSTSDALFCYWHFTELLVNSMAIQQGQQSNFNRNLVLYQQLSGMYCTLVGGLADTPTCTSVAKCIPTTTPKPLIIINIATTS